MNLALGSVIGSALVALVYRQSVESAIATNATMRVYKLYKKGLRAEQVLPGFLRSRVTPMLDHLARLGVTKNGIEPWSILVGSDGNRFRYEREMNMFGAYAKQASMPLVAAY